MTCYLRSLSRSLNLDGLCAPHARHRALLCCLRPLLLAALVLLGGAAHAATYIVDRTDDDGAASACDAGTVNDCSLRGAVIAANAVSGSDTITFAPSLGATAAITLSTVGDSTYGPSALLVSSPITITGPSEGIIIARDTTDPTLNLRLFYVNGSGSLTLQNLTLSNGLAQGGNGGSGGGGGAAGLGGAIFNQGSLLLSGVTLNGNTAQGGNGAGSSAGSGGGGGGLGGNGGNTGGFANEGATSAGGGGGGGGGNAGAGSNGTDASSSTIGNGGNGGPTTGGAGGNGGKFGTNSTGGTSASGAGGGGGGGGAGLSGSSGGNGGFGGGGGNGGYAAGGTSGFGGGAGGAGGSGGFGGGGGGGGGIVDIGLGTDGSEGAAGSGGFGGGAATGNFGGGGAGLGGAVFNEGGTITMTNSTLVSNTASGGIGANNGDGLGGGLFNHNGTVTITNSTFATNSVTGATMQGGALYNLQESGGTATLTVGNSLFQTGTSGGNLANDGGTFTSNGYNLSSDDQTAILTQDTDQNSTDPLLDTNGLQNNGGPTQTIRLLAGSPAIDKGKDLAPTAPVGLSGKDQRGLTRPFDDPSIDPATDGDNSDIGAYEAQDAFQTGQSYRVNTLDDHDDGICGQNDCTLHEAINAANAGDGITITFVENLTGTISLNDYLPDIEANMTIEGPGPKVITVDAGGGGGSVFFVVNSHTSAFDRISGLTITGGANEGGGGIVNQEGELTVQDCVITNNLALGGGGILNGDTLHVIGCTITDNIAFELGGGILNDGDIVTVESSTISHNSVPGFSRLMITSKIGGTTRKTPGVGPRIIDPEVGGGGIYNFGELEVHDSTLNDNITIGNGGGIVNDKGLVLVENSTLSNNFALGEGVSLISDAAPAKASPRAFSEGNGGGAIYNFTGELEVFGSTLADNSAPDTGGIYNGRSPDATLIIGSTILKNHNGNIDNISGEVLSDGYNLSSDAADGDDTTGPDGLLNGPGDIRNTDPQLDTAGLKDNGGPTQTIKLLPTSPALNAGDPAFAPPPDADQRGPGYLRVRGGIIDIGAFEVQAAKAVDDTYLFAESTPLTVPAPGVLSNDVDATIGDLTVLKKVVVTPPLTVRVVKATTNGTLRVKADGSFLYRPRNGFVGQDTFTYQTGTGTEVGNTATVTLRNNTARLSLVFDSTRIKENAGAHATKGTVRVSKVTVSDLTVLVSCDNAKVTVPASVTIPAGKQTATFDVGTVDNSIADGTQAAYITASALGVASIKSGLIVEDDEAVLTLSIAPLTFSEGGGPHAAQGTLTRNTPTTAAMVFKVLSDNKHKAQVPPFVTIPAGKSSINFFIAAIDNTVADGAKRVKILARAANYPLLTQVVTVTDNEAPAPRNVAAPVSLSSAAATVNTVTLNFSGALDAGAAADATRYALVVNGVAVEVTSAAYKEGNVTLALASGALHTGDKVTVAYDLLDGSGGHSVTGKAGPLTVR